jgi:hypothetical protein
MARGWLDRVARVAARSDPRDERASRRGFLRGLAMAGGGVAVATVLPGVAAGSSTTLSVCVNNGNSVATDLRTDSLNCGKCSRRCIHGQACRNGVCVPNCPKGQRSCKVGTCTCVQIDPQNCGACGHVCGSGKRCVKGTCV